MDPVFDQIKIELSSTGLAILNFSLAFIVFGIALDLKVNHFWALLQRPGVTLAGLFSQLVLLPAFTAALIWIWEPLPAIAIGMLLVAACPGGNVSNYVCFLARGDTALSISLTAISTLLIVITLPLNLNFYSNLLGLQTNQTVALSFVEMAKTMLFLIALPLSAGLFISHRFSAFAKRISLVTGRMSLLLFSGFIAVAVISNLKHFGAFVEHVSALVIAHNTLALTLGYLFALLLGFQEKIRRAFSLETGMQNSGLGLVLVFNFFEGNSAMAMVAAFWGIWHLISGMGLAFYWNRKPPGDQASV